jgi:hypothetical protein
MVIMMSARTHACLYMVYFFKKKSVTKNIIQKPNVFTTEGGCMSSVMRQKL